MKSGKMTDYPQDLGIFGPRMPDEVGNLIVDNFAHDATTLGRVARVNKRAHGLVQPRLEKLLLAESLVFGASALLGSHDDLIDEFLGIAGSWRVTNEAMLVVARTFSAFRPSAGLKEYPRPAYPPDWRDHAPFRKVHDWWEWACDTDVHLALRVDLLAFLLLAGELFFEDIQIKSFRERMNDKKMGKMKWENGRLRGEYRAGITHSKCIVPYEVTDLSAHQTRFYLFEAKTVEPNWHTGMYNPRQTFEVNVRLSGMPNAHPIPPPTQRSTINEWALNIMAILEDDPNFYNYLTLPPSIATTGAVVKSLHTGPKTMFKRELPKVNLKNCDILI